MQEKHSIVVTAINKPGVLARISSLITQRGYNIENVIGTATEDPNIYKLNFGIRGTDEQIEKIVKQLNKLIDVIKVEDISHKKNFIIREYLVIKVRATNSKRTDIFELIDVFRAKILDVSKTWITIELSGPPRKISRFIELLLPFGIQQYIRSGEIALRE
ncbi:MAG: acetolactate synthase small subunit [Candidatus Marinimicrobia bacterium]|nr:acetolactate synthase small subunit [Candidatus Neomarinimicrobiota bacterium]